MSPSLQEWLPEGHLARFIADVTEQLDLSAMYAVDERRDGRGQAGYYPLMLLRLLLYGYCNGVVSSRAIERKTQEDVGFRYLAANQHPDHDTIAAFRQQHLEIVSGLFLQTLQLCQKAELIKLGHVALDGSKIQANASKHKAMSYGRMGEAERRLQAEVEELLKRATEADASEDEKYGKGKRGDELPEELSRRESRLVKIQAAKAELEAEAKGKAEQQKSEAEAKMAARCEQEARTGKKPGGTPWRRSRKRPFRRRRRNVTSPIRRAGSCRMVRTRGASCKPTTLRSWSTAKPRSS